jgi:two-component system, NtrC family, sensor histidine kinase HydH
MPGQLPNEAFQLGAGLNFATLMQQRPAVGLVLFNQQHEIIATNPEANRFLGLAGDFPAQLKTFVQETFSTGKSILNRQLMPGLPGNNVRPLALVDTVILSSPGQVHPQVLAILNEPGEAQKLQHHLGQLNRLAIVGTLSASLAHEIKNALVPIRTYFELRKNSQDELTEIASQGLSRVESLVSQLLKYGGPAKPASAPLHVHVILENALRLIQIQLANKGVIVERAFMALTDVVRGDAYQLEQAFSNIFINALDAMSAGGLLSISSKTLPAGDDHNTPSLQVRISDTGAGVAPENLSRLFDTFFTTKPNGTGLGLTITRRIFQEHGGSIAVESAPKKGTTFTVTLPVCE